MPHVVVLGGSVIGSVTALLFARSDWQVTLVDPALEEILDPPEPMRPRRGAPHTVQAHGFMPRSLLELTNRLPDVRRALEAAGAPVAGMTTGLPPHLYDGGRSDDWELETLRIRRVTLDRVVAASVASEPGVTRVAEPATGLLVTPGSPPRVGGLRLSSGDVHGDVVIDAGGRRSPVAGWLADVGAEPIQRFDPCEARYYTRHYAVAPDGPQQNRAFAEVHEFPSLTQLIFLGDNATAMVAQAVHDEDPVLKALRHPDAFSATLAANPALAAWREVLTPITDVFALGAFDNRLRGLVAGNRPLVLGLHLVGDALAMTNPTRGRGVAMGVAACGALHDILAADPVDHETAALAYDAWCRRVLDVYYRETASVDLAMSRRLRAALVGDAAPANAPMVELPDGHPVSAEELDRAAGRDPDLVRVLLRAMTLVDDDRRVASPDVARRVRELTDARSQSAPAPPELIAALADRAQLTQLLAAVPKGSAARYD